MVSVQEGSPPGFVVADPNPLGKILIDSRLVPVVVHPTSISSSFGGHLHTSYPICAGYIAGTAARNRTSCGPCGSDYMPEMSFSVSNVSLVVNLVVTYLANLGVHDGQRECARSEHCNGQPKATVNGCR